MRVFLNYVFSITALFLSGALSIYFFISAVEIDAMDFQCYKHYQEERAARIAFILWFLFLGAVQVYLNLF
ncbi:MAG: hypothetical protein QG620_155 [Patescibacteria group bacterium]|nr:hypothetical protein [Patescibacteria group bacterium]